MGVEYQAGSGYGFVLDPDDNFERLAKLLGVEPDEGPYEVVEALCKKYGLDFVCAGDGYAGYVSFLIGDTFVIDNYNFKEMSHTSVVSDLRYKIFDTLRDLGLNKPVGYYVGMHVF
jgi:hypothetical protein